MSASMSGCAVSVSKVSLFSVELEWAITCGPKGKKMNIWKILQMVALASIPVAGVYLFATGC